MMKRLFLVLAATVLATGAYAQQPPMPKPLADQAQRGAQVYYLGRFEGLDGWAMIRGGQPEFYYATPDNKAVVMGILFDSEGNMQTAAQLNNLPKMQSGGVADLMASQMDQSMIATGIDALPAPGAQVAAPQPAPAAPVPTDPAQVATTHIAPAATPSVPLAAVGNQLSPATPANRLFLEVQAANHVTWGQPNLPTFYAFVDPNCPHCQRFLTEVEPAVTAGLVAVNMIPLGFDDKSKKQAAFMLASGDGASRMMAYIKGDASMLPAPDGANLDGITANVRILEQWRLLVTPVIVYKAGKTGEVKLIRGRPVDVPGAVADLRGQ